MIVLDVLESCPLGVWIDRRDFCFAIMGVNESGFSYVDVLDLGGSLVFATASKLAGSFGFGIVTVL